MNVLCFPHWDQLFLPVTKKQGFDSRVTLLNGAWGFPTKLKKTLSLTENGHDTCFQGTYVVGGAMDITKMHGVPATIDIRVIRIFFLFFSLFVCLFVCLFL